MTSKSRRNIILITLAVMVTGLLLFVLRTPEPVDANRYLEPDRLFATVEANVRNQAGFEVIVDIDHSRLGAEAGSPMPPSHVLIWSDPELDAAIVKHNPLAAVDLPLRVLAYEDQGTGMAMVIANSYDFVAQRHSLPEDATVRARYEGALAKAVEGIAGDRVASFASDTMPDSGLVTLSSPHDFATTEKRMLDVINAQGDTVIFGAVDFAARSMQQGIDIPPLTLILFGGPGPGGKAMADAPTLGLDAFCQKLVIWEDEEGKVHVTFNDLLALAERQDVSAGLPLRVVNRRLRETFSAALES